MNIVPDYLFWLSKGFDPRGRGDYPRKLFNNLIIKPRKNSMKKDKIKSIFLFLLAISLFFLIISCANTPKVVGEWQEIGKMATLEFWKDGSFKAVDNQGMAVSGKYTLYENGIVRFEIANQGSSSEIVTGKLSVLGDKLTITSVYGHEVERYRRVK